jgi:hypothetical protein
VSKNATNYKCTSWTLLRNELWRRTKGPAAHASFVMYFLIAVFLIGAGGVWLELYSLLVLAETANSTSPSVSGLRTAVITFFPALAGSACMQLVWAEGKNKSLRSFAVVALVVMTIVAIGISPSVISSKTVFVVGAIASLLALWIWWIANADQPSLLDTNLEAPLGKDPQSELSGNLDGFTV